MVPGIAEVKITVLNRRRGDRNDADTDQGSAQREQHRVAVEGSRTPDAYHDATSSA